MGQPPIGRYSRGYLPHMELGEQAQFLTWRLADALPVSLLNRWEEELSMLPEEERRRLLWQRIEKFIDRGHGSEILRKSRVADMVQESLYLGMVIDTNSTTGRSCLITFTSC